VSETLHAANGRNRDEVKKLRDMLLTLPIKTKRPTECGMLAYDCHTRSMLLACPYPAVSGYMEPGRFERCRGDLPFVPFPARFVAICKILQYSDSTRQLALRL
jgi:hypothetical protein